MLLRKIEAISKWPEPKTVKQVKQFLGVCAYYTKFIEKFAKICSPLHDLTKGYKKGSSNASCKWTQLHKSAFDTLKTMLVNHLV